MLQIENTNLKVTISELGGELQSIFNKNSNFEYLWSDKNRNLWKRHAPILFPFVGKSFQDSYFVNHEKYHMSQHGFLRDQKLKVVNQNHNSITLAFQDNKTTFEIYPFHFTFSVTYSLDDDTLYTSYQINNLSDVKLPFGLGSHPGFNVPFDSKEKFNDYQLKLKPLNPPLKMYEVNPIPFRNGNIVPTPIQGQTIPLKHELFKNGLMILENPEITEITLKSTKSDHNVTINLKDFPYLALWTVEDQEAPFICIEPFAGLPDKYGQIVDIYKKQGNNIISPKTKKSFIYEMTFK
mgnify:CR=1 FL=1